MTASPADQPDATAAFSSRPSQLLSIERCDDRLNPPSSGSLRFGQRCREAGIRISMGARASALDNAVCEAFFGSLKRERLNRRSWPTRRETQSAIFEWIEGWYNPRRLHSTLGYLSPNNYEQLELDKEDMKEEAA